MPICVGSHAATQTTHFVLVKSSIQTDVMAAVAQLNQAQMQAAVEEYSNFVMTFRDLGAGGSVTVSDVYRRMREKGLPTGCIDPHMDNTDPTANAPTTAARGKNVSRLLSFSKSCQCSMQFVYFLSNK